MKFGRHLVESAEQHPEWRGKTLDYTGLKKVLKSLQAVAKPGVVSEDVGKPVASLTVPRSPTGFGSSPVAYVGGKAFRETDFFTLLEEEIDKIDEYVKNEVKDLRSRVDAITAQVDALGDNADGTTRERLSNDAKLLGDSFLSLEKFVNINYTGFYKILKKHDKLLPTIPCRQYYMSRLHNQGWITGDFSDIFVRLSSIHSALRRDQVAAAQESSTQNFVRSTKKYWVRTEDVSTIKHLLLQHLPVFQIKQSELAGDSQLTNSVYFDNSRMELYTGRLEKRPNAIAIRLRWYGPEVKTVFVERKTHKESWKGELSVKERFTLKEEQVMPFLRGEYTVEDAERDARAAGKSDKDVAKLTKLFTEIYRQIDSKQLFPMLRTQYMRVAFQIPFNPSVRVSLDTNLAMIKENPDDMPSCLASSRWYRDPRIPVPRTEITHFPHAVLEVKLSLLAGEDPPAWVEALTSSGMCTHVHKYSKFIHGSATLLPDLVQSVPYWFDDASIRKSIMLTTAPNGIAPSMTKKRAAIDMGAGGAARAAGKPPLPRDHSSQGLSKIVATPSGGAESRAEFVVGTLKGRSAVGANGEAEAPNHPLLARTPQLDLMAAGGGAALPPAAEEEGCHCLDALRSRECLKLRHREHLLPRKVPMKIEPKTFFANERTFLNWLHMAITMGTIAAGLLAFASDNADPSIGVTFTYMVALILLPVSILTIAYAMWTFYWRAVKIRKREEGPYDDRKGPITLALVIMGALWSIVVMTYLNISR
eukprot:jgi/Mesvir1/29610/Mv21464-RA.3